MALSNLVNNQSSGLVMICYKDLRVRKLLEPTYARDLLYFIMLKSPSAMLLLEFQLDGTYQ